VTDVATSGKASVRSIVLKKEETLHITLYRSCRWVFLLLMVSHHIKVQLHF